MSKFTYLCVCISLCSLTCVCVCVCVPTRLCVRLGLFLYIRRILYVCMYGTYVCICLSMYYVRYISYSSVTVWPVPVHDRTEGRVVSTVRKALWMSSDELLHTSTLAAACPSYLNCHIKMCLSDEKLGQMITSIACRDWEGAELCLRSPNTLPYRRHLWKAFLNMW